MLSDFTTYKLVDNSLFKMYHVCHDYYQQPNKVHNPLQNGLFQECNSSLTLLHVTERSRITCICIMNILLSHVTTLQSTCTCIFIQLILDNMYFSLYK